MKYLLVIGDGMADDPVPALGGKTPLQAAATPAMDHMAARGVVGNAITCPPPLPAGSETAILSILGCDPRRYFTGRSPMEAAAYGIRLSPGDAAFRCNLVTLEDGELPYVRKRLLSHNAGAIDAPAAMETTAALLSDSRFARALSAAGMELHRFPSFRQLAVQHHSDLSGIRFTPPHDHLGKTIGPLLPAGAPRAGAFAGLMRLAHQILDHHPVTEARRDAGKLPANGIWFWAEGTAVELPSFRSQYGMDGAVVSAVPLCHGIGVLRGLEAVHVAGATGDLDTDFPGKLDAVWDKLQQYDFVCLHLEAPDERTHDGDLPGKLRAIESLDGMLISPLLERLETAGLPHRVLVLSDHKTLIATRGHAAGPVPFLLYDSRKDTKRGSAYDEADALSGPLLANGCDMLDYLFEKETLLPRGDRSHRIYF